MVHFAHTATDASSKIKEKLSALKWQVIEHSFPFQQLQPGGIVFVIDELYSPMLTAIQADQWQCLQNLMNCGNRVLWLTAGSQFDVTNPSDALIHGLARTVRAEDPSVSLTTLDVESSSGTNTVWAIDAILESLRGAPPRKYVESEYVERKGIIYVSRITPDHKINQAEKDDSNGIEPETTSLHDSEATIRLRCERVGTLESLQYAKISATELPLPDNCVEVELAAAGVNFKVSGFH